MLDQTSSSRAHVRVAPPVNAPQLRPVVIALVGALVLTLATFAAPALGTAHAAAIDVTVTTKAKNSLAYRKTVTLQQWQASKHGKSISYRESHNVCSAVSADGRYRGKWQMTQSLWSSHGGLKFAKVPQRATCPEQDRVARRIWVQSWWWPWGG